MASVIDEAPGRVTFAERAYREIKARILENEFPAGSIMLEQELAALLEMSRTPVREALIRLADEGLVDILPQRGSFVAPIRLRDVEEAQFIRESLEVAVARRLAGHCSPRFLSELRLNLARQESAVAERDRDLFLELDEAFHRGLCEEAGLSKSWRVIQSVKLQMDRVRYLSLPEPGHLDVLLAQHRQITSAIESGDMNEAGRHMSAHLKEVLGSANLLRQKLAHLIEK